MEQELLTTPEHPSSYPFCLNGVPVVQCCPITCVQIFSFVWCQLRFPGKNDVWFAFAHICYVGVFMFYFYIYIYLHFVIYWCPTRFHVRWCSFRSTVTLQMLLVEQALLTVLEQLSSPRFLVGLLIFSFPCKNYYQIACHTRTLMNF